MRARSAARNRMSLITAGQASASTQICMKRSGSEPRGLAASAAGRLLLALGGALFFQRLRRPFLVLFLAIHTFAHDILSALPFVRLAAKIRQKSDRNRAVRAAAFDCAAISRACMHAT